MKTFRLGEREINFSNSWEDLTIKQWIEFYKLNEKKNATKDIDEDYYLLSVLEIMCNVLPGELDELDLNDYVKYLNELDFMLENPNIKNPQPFEYNGITYTLKPNLSNLKMGEYITIKTLQSKYTNNLDGIPYLLAVLIRPSTLVKNSETGQEEWVQESFDTKNLDWRADLIYNNFKAIDWMNGVNFFLNGKET